MRSRRTRYLWIALLLAALGGALFYYFGGSGKKLPPFVWRSVKVERGEINSVITSTGTLQALNTVAVGTQVSGTLSHLYVDFNDFVRAGQVIAQLDTALLAASVLDAKAALARAEVSVEQTRRDYERGKLLYEKKVIPEVEFDNLRFASQTAQGNLLSAQANYSRAIANLRFATITAPISGVIVARSVEVGQTVASSFSTPTLFSIAADLTQMEVQASVDEADIGQVRVGQTVRFTVESYPNRTFRGQVTQRRLQPTTVANVVNYTVIVKVSNPEKLLMPGMTATLTFEIDKREGVLRVPNSALRFRPPGEFYEHFGKTNRDSVRKKNAASGSGEIESDSTDTESYISRLWLVRPGGNLAYARVRVGLTDGTYSELLGPAGTWADSLQLREGIEVATGLEKMNLSSKSSSPFSFKFGPPQRSGGAGSRSG